MKTYINCILLFNICKKKYDVNVKGTIVYQSQDIYVNKSLISDEKKFSFLAQASPRMVAMRK